MTDKEREELIDRMALTMFAYVEDQSRLRFRDLARAALAVAEPVIREECARIVEKGNYETRWTESERAIAAAIREKRSFATEGGSDDI